MSTTEDWVEQSLEAWGQWRGTVGMAEGWGGAGNAMDGIGWGKAVSGVHSDPVLAEYIRALKMRFGDSALINRLLREFCEKDRRAIFLRYVGEKVAVTSKIIVSIGTVPVSGYPGLAGRVMSRPTIRLELEVPLHTDYSGKLSMIRVAEILDISEDAVGRIIRRVKKDLRMQIVMMAKVRKGQAGESRRAA